MNFDKVEFNVILAWIPAAVSLLIFLVVLAVLIFYLLRHFLIRHQTSPGIDSNFTEPMNRGLDPSVMAAIPTFRYKPNDESEVECLVCLGSIAEKNVVRVLPNCIHMFHVECIDTWLGSHSTCPTCGTIAEPMPPERDLARNTSAIQSNETGESVSQLRITIVELLNRESER